jgi:hypothetical protein
VNRSPYVDHHATSAYLRRVEGCTVEEAIERIQRIVVEGQRLRRPPSWMRSWGPTKNAYFAPPDRDVVVVVRRDTGHAVTVLTPPEDAELLPLMACRLAAAWGARLTTSPAR